MSNILVKLRSAYSHINILHFYLINFGIYVRERQLCLYTKVHVKDTKLKWKENISYLIIKTNEKNLIGNCTSKLLTTSINSWNAFHSSQAVQVPRDPALKTCNEHYQRWGVENVNRRREVNNIHLSFIKYSNHQSFILSIKGCMTI